LHWQPGTPGLDVHQPGRDVQGDERAPVTPRKNGRGTALSQYI
jgi:hypothetical protein